MQFKICCSSHWQIALNSGGASYRQGRPRPYRFRSGPTSGPTTPPGSEKSKISVVHSLAVLKGHPECLECKKTLWRTPQGGAHNAPRPSSFWGYPLPENPTSALGPLGLQPWPFAAFGPHSLPPQIRLPKSAYVVNWTNLPLSPFIIPYIR